MMSALIVERPTLAVAHRDTVFTDRSGYARARYDVMPDGQRFVVNTGMIADGSTLLTLVANWTTLLEQR